MTNKKVSFTIIQHIPRLELSLSLNEYCVADTIYHLSNNLKNKKGGWCWKSKANIGNQLGLSKQTIHKILNKLIEKKLVIKNEAGQLRTTSLWYETVILSSQNKLPKVKKVSHDKGGKVTQNGQNSLHNKDIDKDSENSFSVKKLLPSSIKVNKQTLVVLQSFVDIYKAEYRAEPALGVVEVNCVRHALDKMELEDALQLVEDWFNSTRVFDDHRPLINKAFSTSSITKWKAMEL